VLNEASGVVRISLVPVALQEISLTITVGTANLKGSPLRIRVLDPESRKSLPLTPPAKAQPVANPHIIADV
jgi:hypothetical protein